MGKIICFEGIDGAGKETQASLFKNYCDKNDLKSIQLSFPDYSTLLGKYIKEALSDEKFNAYALQMLFSADRIRQISKILKLKKDFDYLIMDRYKWSGIVYGSARNLDYNWLINLESPLPNPDITVLINITPQKSLNRTNGSDTFEQNISLLEKCYSLYQSLALKDNWFIIDGNKDIQIIHNEIINLVI